MKYPIAKGRENETIYNYKIMYDKLAIFFLDSSRYEVEYTQENEEKTRRKMLEQANEREKKVDTQKLKNARIMYVIYIVGEAILSIWNLCSFINNDYMTPSIVPLVLAILTGGISLLFIFKLKWNIEEVNDITKYSIYLRIREDYAKFKDNANIFNGVRLDKKELSINTLDDYSLKDIRNIRDNITRIYQYGSYFDKVNEFE